MEVCVNGNDGTGWDEMERKRTEPRMLSWKCEDKGASSQCGAQWVVIVWGKVT